MRLVLYKRGKVYWVRGGRHFFKSTGHTTQASAELVRRRWERELADPVYFRAHKATVESAAERFLGELKASAKSEGTIRFYDVKVRHVVRLLGGVRLTDLTHERVLRYTQEREEEGGHRYTIHRELTALRRILKSAARAQEFSRDWKSVIPEYSTGYVPQTEFHTEEQLWMAIGELEPARGAAVAYILATASDYSPAFEALRSDIHPDRVMVKGTKTATRKRAVPRISIFEPFLKYALKYADGEGDTLLRPWGQMARDLRRACRRAGVPEITARSLRRTAATWLVKRGVPFSVAAKFLGHASTAMLQKVYGQLDTADVGRLIEERLTVQRMYDMSQEKQHNPDSSDSRQQGKHGANGEHGHGQQD